jgi:hypothetical protein
MESSQSTQLKKIGDKNDSFWSKILTDASEANSRRIAKSQEMLESPSGVPLTVVTNLNDLGPGSLRQALVDVPIGGIVSFAPGLSGVIMLTTGSLVIDKPIQIMGPGARQISVDGTGLMMGSVFVINIPGLMPASRQDLPKQALSPMRKQSGDSPQGAMPLEVHIAGLTIANGKGSLPIISTATEEPHGGSLTFGGGIYAKAAAGIPVGLYIDECTISDNFASGDGGGVYLSGITQVIISNTTFDGNAARNGGGIFIDESGQSVMLNSTFSNNLGWVRGGAIFRTAINQVVGAAFTTISGNFAGLSGGGIFNVSAPPGVTRDSSQDAPKGAEPEIGAFQLLSSIVASNTQASLPLAEGPSGTPFYPDLDGIFGADYSLIGIIDGSSGITHGVAGNIAGDSMAPVDPELLPLTNNGGPTDTMALTATSPARDKGSNASVVMNSDQRGALRPWYPTLPAPFPGMGEDGSDMGAYEYMFTTASGVSIAGRISDDLGRGIIGANVSVMDSETGLTKTVRTNQFGRYNVEGLIAGRVFVVSVSSKSSRDNPVQILHLADSYGEMNFTLTRR